MLLVEVLSSQKLNKMSIKHGQVVSRHVLPSTQELMANCPVELLMHLIDILRAMHIVITMLPQ